jgi:hypothetical protein
MVESGGQVGEQDGRGSWLVEALGRRRGGARIGRLRMKTLWHRLFELVLDFITAQLRLTGTLIDGRNT